MMNKQVAVPVKNLKMILERFGKGELTARSELVRKDEIGQLASSFNQMADQVSSLVEQERKVVRSVAHEVRGPLTRMRLLLERVRSGKRLSETLDKLESEIQTLSKMPDILLQLSMVESGQSTIKKLPIEIDLYLESELEKMNLQGESRNCTFAYQRDESLAESWIINTDESILSRCLENILDNALRHAPAGTSIDVKLEKNSDSYIITIRDYGDGVPEQEVSAIFRPFFRSDASRNRHTGGLGLGLAITRTGIQALGGKVWAENASPGLRVMLSMPEK
jgi:two-component system sensor histidine kinase CpxA